MKGKLTGEEVVLRLKNLVSLTAPDVRKEPEHVKEITDYVLRTSGWSKQEFVSLIESLSPPSSRNFDE